MTSVEHPVSTAPRERRRGVLAFVGTTVASAGAAGVLASVDPNQPGHYPTCPFLALSGLYCPGCGSLRAVHALTGGDVVTAWDRNPLAVLLLPFVVLAWVMWGLRLAGRTTWSPTRLPAAWIWTLLGVVLAYWVLRNVPAWTFLSPA